MSDPDTSAFDILLQLAGDGSVREVLLRPETNVALCLSDGIAEDRFPPPPRPAHWLHIAMTVDAQEGRTGLVYGADHAFLVTAPAGWVLDNQSGAAQGLHAVFYRRGETWESATARMYARAVTKRDGVTLEDFMARDVARFREGAPNLVVEAGRAVRTADGKSAVVRQIRNDAYGNFEAVAYIDEARVVALLVLTTPTQDVFNAALPAFADLVGSYSWYEGKVR